MVDTKRRPVSATALVQAIRAFGNGGARIIVAIAGPPAAGKSTLAKKLSESLNAEQPGCAAVLQMDGYHYDDLVLTPRGLRARKGAPDTFDALGFRHMLLRLKADEEPEIATPVFDRSIEIARAGASIIGSNVRFIVTEGNYLLLDEGYWRDLHQLYDITVMIEVSERVLRARLEKRWEALSGQALIDKIEGNDLPNGRRVLKDSIAPDYVISACEEG
jgi:pantothenate kinase